MTPPKTPHAVEILAIGKELAQGDVVDTNSAFIARRLVPLGFDVSRHVTVTDEIGTIKSALGRACHRAAAVVVTGGLGPTDDDLTRHAVAELCGVELALHPPSLDRLEQIFRSLGRPMPACNRVQAMMPSGSRVIPNPAGTAAGFAIQHDGATLVCLPGVPREMKAMADEAIRHVAEATASASAEPRQPAVVRVLNCFGVSESQINARVGGMMAPDRNPALGTMACDGVIRLRLMARADSAGEADALLDADEAHLREQFGAAIFSSGETTLAEVVAEELQAARCTLATAESCTGGLVGHWLTQVPGISKHYRGGVVAYSNEAKASLLGVPGELFESVGAVSPEVATAMAEGAAARLQADIGIGVTGIAGPGGAAPGKPVGLVHIAVARPGGTRHREFRFPGERVVVKDRAAKSALNMVRLELQERRTAPRSLYTQHGG